LSNNNHLRLIL